MTSFTSYGWVVCSWALIMTFQVAFSSILYQYSTNHLDAWVVRLSNFSTQPDTGRPHMQNTIRVVHSYD